MKLEMDKTCNSSFISEREVVGLVLAEANKGRPYVELSGQVNGADFLMDFNSLYKPELETENDKFWTEMLEDYMTQPVTLCLTEKIGTYALKVPTPLIISGDAPTSIYKVTEKFIEQYSTTIRSSNETIEERENLESMLNSNWRTLTGMEIDRIRTEIKSKQNLAIDGELLGRMTEVLRRIGDSRKVIDIWASLRRGSENLSQLEYGWVKKAQTYRY